jgi:hypothetical protein
MIEKVKNKTLQLCSVKYQLKILIISIITTSNHILYTGTAFNYNNNNNKKFIFQVISNTKQWHHKQVQVQAEVAFWPLTSDQCDRHRYSADITHNIQRLHP